MTLNVLFYIKNRNQTTTYLMSVLFMADYFTSKIEIKPQQIAQVYPLHKYYFTSKIEIKPQLAYSVSDIVCYYFTSKIEIKPQQKAKIDVSNLIILHQKQKSNHNWLNLVLLAIGLFYIKNRNQTTTSSSSGGANLGLFYIKNRNQTTTFLCRSSLRL